MSNTVYNVQLKLLNFNILLNAFVWCNIDFVVSGDCNLTSTDAELRAFPFSPKFFKKLENSGLGRSVCSVCKEEKLKGNSACIENEQFMRVSMGSAD